MSNSLLRKKSIDKILADAEAGLLEGHGQLNKVLGVKDLTFMGIAAVVGAGIFSSIGKACYDGGPAVIFLYIFTAVACGFAALCYAEFASTVPVAGSAYTYSYVAFGEIFAWIIGWDLLMEYAIGNIAVAISWSDYFTGLLDKADIHIPPWLTMDFSTAHSGFLETDTLVAAGNALKNIDPSVLYRHDAWQNAPQVFGLHLIMDLPALLIVALITAVVYVGINESRKASNIMVIIKLLVIFLVIVLGGYYANPVNWSPFNPNGFSGIMKGVSAVFFAYIGFDAISTTAEECKDPQRDLPRGMIYSLIICTILYVLLALVLTGMVHYTKLNVGDPSDDKNWLGAIVSKPHMEKILSYIELAQKEGGKILHGGNRVQLAGEFAEGYFIAPTIIEGLPHDCRTNQEEIFGPAVTLQPFDTEEEVLSYANSTNYGLAASVWTQHLTKAHHVAAKLHSGIVWINCWLLRDLRTPFGGVKSSGVGREGGFEALNFFTEEKNVCIKL